MGPYGCGKRAFYERSLAIREKALGSDHPDTVTSLNNLGWLFHDEGNILQAVELMRRAVAIREVKLSPDHPLTKDSRRSLAIFEAKLP